MKRFVQALGLLVLGCLAAYVLRGQGSEDLPRDTAIRANEGDGETGVSRDPSTQGELASSVQLSLRAQAEAPGTGESHVEPSAVPESSPDPTMTEYGKPLRDLTGIERGNYLRDHRLEYMKTHRDLILRTLEELEVAKGALQTNSKAYFLTKRSICLLLDSQNRAELVPEGQRVSIKSEEGQYAFQSGNWIYRFGGEEFPEWVYFCEHLAKHPGGALTEATFPEMPAYILALVHQHAGLALAAYPGDD